MGRLSVHPHDGTRRIGPVFVPNLAFEHQVTLAAGMAVGHERIHFDLGLGFVEHERRFLLALELAKAHAGAEILPGDVFLKPGFVDVETQPVRHAVGEDHATPSGR